MYNTFPRVGKLESSSEHRPPQGEGVCWLGPHDRKPCLTVEKKKKKTDSSRGTHPKTNIKSTKKFKCMILGPSRCIISPFVSTPSHGFRFFPGAIFCITG